MDPTPTPPTSAQDAQSLVQRCLDAQGYLLFAAILTPTRDGAGNNIIEFQYRRYHMNLEDARHAVLVLNEEVKKEVKALLESHEPEV